MVEAFAALAEPNRFRIVELLRTGPHAVNDLRDRLQLSQPLVSKHLRVQREAGLVEMQPQARQHLYELSGKRLKELHDWLERYRQLWEARFDDLDALLTELNAPGPTPRTKTKEFHGRHHRK